MTEEYRKCDGRGVICPTLEKRLQDGYCKGLNLQRVMNFKTGEECVPILLYKTAAKDPGLVLNFCPWCGSELNHEYILSSDTSFEKSVGQEKKAPIVRGERYQ